MKLKTGQLIKLKDTKEYGWVVFQDETDETRIKMEKWEF